MDKYVKNVFLVLLYATIAFLFYFIFFGNFSLRGDSRDGRVNNYTVKAGDSSQWRGVLFIASENVEISIADYYYKYCYLPSVLDDIYVDEALGASLKGSDKLIVKTDLTDSGGSTSPSENDFVDFSSADHYSEGWK